MCLLLSSHIVFIPNAEEITAARRQRRAARAQKEFISLRTDGQRSPGSTPDHCSRDNEESPVDDDDEPDDHERRIEFAPRSKSIRERIAEKLGMREDGGGGGKGGEEERKSDSEQMDRVNNVLATIILKKGKGVLDQYYYFFAENKMNNVLEKLCSACSFLDWSFVEKQTQLRSVFQPAFVQKCTFVLILIGIDPSQYQCGNSGH